MSSLRTLIVAEVIIFYLRTPMLEFITVLDLLTSNNPIIATIEGRGIGIA
jgi:hypothetical protein